MNRLSILFIALFFTSLLLPTQTTGQDDIVVKFLSDTTLRNAGISLYVANAETGAALMASSPQLSLVPASVMKLVTTATALELLGPGFSFQTRILCSGSVNDKTLAGNLVVEGGGDPTLASEYFTDGPSSENLLDTWAHQVKNAGIDTIKGDVVADASVYAENDLPTSWLWEDLGQYYGAAAHGIALYDNTFTIGFETGKAGTLTRIISIHPVIPDLDLKNEVLASTEPRDKAYVFGSPYDCSRIVKGTLPQNRPLFEVKSSVPDPALLLASELLEALKQAGVVVKGQALKVNQKRDGSTDSLLFVHQSPTLAEIIVPLNHHSVNLFAEHLCKHIGLISQGLATTASGTETIKAFWAKRGIDTRSLFIADGSGLSRFNAITAKTLTEILCAMKKGENFDAFYRSIPLAGQQGTMRYYFNESPLNGNARIKSGSMTRVRCLSGYLTTKNRSELAFTILANNYSCTSSELVSKIETFLAKVYEKY